PADATPTGNLAQPCPRCSATGTPSSPGTGTCDRGPRATMACTTTSSTGVTRDCPTGGTDATHPCTPGGGACLDGSHVGVIPINLSPLTTRPATPAHRAGPVRPGPPARGLLGRPRLPHHHRERRGGGGRPHRHPGERHARLGVLHRGHGQRARRCLGRPARPWRHLPA